jgi:putative two-component system response regulator
MMYEKKPLAIVADDEETNHLLMTRILEKIGFQIAHVYDGEKALELALNNKPDLVLLDVLLTAGITGFDVCRKIKSNPLTRFIPTILITGLNTEETKVEGLEAGADDYFVKPFNPAELTARIKSLMATKRALEEFESAERVISSLAVAIEAKDPNTKGHSVRVSHLAVKLGQAMGLPEASLRSLRLGSLLHDLGKIGISETILLCEGKLSNEERDAMRSHPEIGERMCAPLKSLEHVLRIIRSHHERLDGSGYPDGLSGDEIPLLVRIVSMVDVYDALTTPRPYRRVMTPPEALDELAREVDQGKLDRNVFNAWRKSITQRVEATAMPVDNR